MFWRPAGAGPPVFAAWFSPEHCLVYTVGKKIAAAVYMLPCRMEREGTLYPGHYIYAAATLPAFRGRGFMACLMEAVALEGVKRGHVFSAVLPAEKGLYSYYGRFGYREYFEAEYTEMQVSELETLAKWEGAGRRLISPEEALSCQKEFLSGREGSIIWNPRDVFYAFSMNHFCKGQLIAAGSPLQNGFALCTEENGIQFISETAFSEKAFPYLNGQHSSVCPFCPIPFSYAGGKKQSVFGKRGREDSFWNGKTSWGLGTSIAEGKRSSVARFSFRLKNRHIFSICFFGIQSLYCIHSRFRLSEIHWWF